MKQDLKAVVFRTPRLRETMSFFTEQLGFSINEYSPTHFVIYSKGIRVLFVDSINGLDVELYFTKKSAGGLTAQEDPNQIKIIIS